MSIERELLHCEAEGRTSSATSDWEGADEAPEKAVAHTLDGGNRGINNLPNRWIPYARERLVRNVMAS